MFGPVHQNVELGPRRSLPCLVFAFISMEVINVHKIVTIFEKFGFVHLNLFC